MKKTVLVLVLVLGFLLRFYDLGKVPLSLYWDEASLGFNAYTISQTLRDEHGTFLPVSNFVAFGDFKAPGYIYVDAFFIKLLGRTEFAVRLPSALAGVFLSLVAYFLIKEKRAALLAAFFVTISPWAIQMSRGAFEANVAVLLSSLAVCLFIRNKLIMSAIFFAMSLYTFNSQRVFVPMMLVALFVIYFKQIWYEKKRYFIFIVLFLTLLLPLIPHMLSREGKLRFNEVTWLNDLAPIQLSNNLIKQNNNALWAKIIYNRRVFYGQMFVSHYLDNFRPDFLFVKGDVNPRLSVQGVGEMYWLEAIFVIIGLAVLLRKRDKISAVLVAWLLLAPVPAAFARETPHALRTLNVLPVPQVLVAVGLAYLIAKWRVLVLPVVVVYLFGVGYYQNYYYKNYPINSANFWQYGYKEAVVYCEANKKDYDHIYVTSYYGRPYIYFLFYGNQSVETYWRTRDTGRDWYGNRFIFAFDKYRFSTFDKYGRNLYVLAPQDDNDGLQLIKTISDSYGNIIFEIYKNL